MKGAFSFKKNHENTFKSLNIHKKTFNCFRNIKICPFIEKFIKFKYTAVAPSKT